MPAPGSDLTRQSKQHVRLRRLSLASLASQIGIVVTGGAVRLTGSGLGCPEFPSCTADSLVNTPEYGIHGYIEFGNRLLTFVLVAIAVATAVAAWRYRPRRVDLRILASVLLAGVPAQALVGGLTVLTGLNPWVVMWHFLISMGLIATATALWRATVPAKPPAHRLSAWVSGLASVTAGGAAVALALGTIVTGAGPHAGDPTSPRNGLDLEAVTHLHADSVALLLGLSIGLWFAVRAAGSPGRTGRATSVLIGVELAQALIGFAQYHLGVPALLVGVHMLGAALLTAAVADVWLACRAAGPSPVPSGTHGGATSAEPVLADAAPR